MTTMRGWLPLLGLCAGLGSVHGAGAAPSAGLAGGSLGFSEQDGKLEVLLVNTMCDAYDAYIGELRNGRFSGAHVQYGWGSKTVGQVSGVFMAGR